MSPPLPTLVYLMVHGDWGFVNLNNSLAPISSKPLFGQISEIDPSYTCIHKIL